METPKSLFRYINTYKTPESRSRLMFELYGVVCEDINPISI